MEGSQFAKGVYLNKIRKCTPSEKKPFKAVRSVGEGSKRAVPSLFAPMPSLLIAAPISANLWLIRPLICMVSTLC
ncbi:unnamed protein product [Bursaphelenchus okinawaensis]|uniref:Uncharacterized protein n=1 Tax=Bursaphelenchus okinawaensis TaxID=465554 RepID=A0A811JST5_9BILA|nr:unnamed protein product [Bursaphelenchus okinawaensis]CAG9081428.1 unnamed protein product [Bursaphelenchus okinawaensis]